MYRVAALLYTLSQLITQLFVFALNSLDFMTAARLNSEDRKFIVKGLKGHWRHRKHCESAKNIEDGV